MRDEITVGLAQWLPEPGRPDHNLATALGLISELAQQGADLVVLPELWPCGYDALTLAEDAASSAEPLDGVRSRALADRARELGIWLAAGSVPERDGTALYNTSLLFDRQGDLRAWHRKAHLYSPTGEAAIFAPGDRLTTCRTDEFGVVGMCVCFDGDFPETARGLRVAGATLVIMPAAYESAASHWWRVLYPAMALANGQWWLMTNQCGTNASGTLLGESQVVSPCGEVLAHATSARDGESPPAELLLASVPLRDGIERAEKSNGALWELRRPGLPVHEF